MKKFISTIFIVLMSCAIFANGSQDTTTSTKGNLPPITVHNGNIVSTYTSVPQKAVVVGYQSGSIMLALGLENNIKYLTLLDSKIDEALPEHISILKKMEKEGKITYIHPKQEAVLAENPDFVLAPQYYFDNGMGTIEEYKKLGIKTYVANFYNDKYGKPVNNVEKLYDNIRDIGKIFRVEDRANKLIASLKARVAKASKSAKNRKTVKIYVHAWGKEKPGTVAGGSVDNNIFPVLGAKNIFSDIKGKTFAGVSWESVIERNPDVIVIHCFGEPGYGKKAIKYLKSRKELSGISAIKNNKFLEIPLTYVFLGMQNIDYVEAVGEYLDKNGF
ncbi:MAG: hypothetical protein CR988_02425 [Treponema sp.]|nr:MAG: hypothetical protein CR988_02425 [Treponema sp.]